MPTTSLRQPSYCRQREKNRPDRAYVIIDGKRHQLGKYGSPESYQKLAELLAGPKNEPEAERPPEPAHTSPTMAVLMLAYLRHAIEQYGGEKASEVTHTKGAFKILRKHRGEILAKDFGPKAYKVVRQAMIDAGWSRTYVTDQLGRIKRMIGWGVEEEILPGDARHRLDAVRPLARGEFGVRETEPVRPVSEADLEATIAELSPVRADMVRLLLLTGMRPGELCQISRQHIDMAGDVWLYRPPTHKTQKKGKVRVVAIGPKAQAILQPYLFRDPCFPWSRDSLRKAVRRAAKRAGVPHWWPYRCRHNAGTTARESLGLDGAQVLLGHAKADVTQVYAETTEKRAVEIARLLG